MIFHVVVWSFVFCLILFISFLLGLFLFFLLRVGQLSPLGIDFPEAYIPVSLGKHRLGPREG